MIVFELGDDDAEAAPAPAIADAAPDDDDERTLTELDAVPTIDDTMVVSRAELEALAGTAQRARAARPPAGVARRDRRRGRNRVGRSSRRSSSGPSRARTSSAYSPTVTSPSTRASPGTSSAACGCTGCATKAPSSPASSRRRSAATLFDHDLRTYDRALDAVEAVRGAGRPVSVRTESRARQPRRGRHHHRPRLRERLHRAPVGDLGRARSPTR